MIIESRSNSLMKKENLPDKMAFSLEEVSRLAQLDPEIIETWEKEFYFLNAGLTGKGKRIFRKKDLAIILRLKELLESKGLTLAGAKRKIEMEFGIKGSAPMHPERLKKILFQVRSQLQEIASELDKP